ncbi:hypothetical protein Nepgr_032228 [Nepenthes gracilis]|uniref:Uncharacterized protein n=1 Tax=Nepenthes gracilis TaxID=150966 RepID=A0AAD3TIW7_NEPGR|nr:hypothetical protein Nepgr_032228 [Nepenthes gracilis]
MLCGSIAAVIPILVDIQTSRGQHFAGKKLSLLPGRFWAHLGVLCRSIFSPFECIGAGFPSLVLQWIDAVAEYSRFGAAVVEQLLDTDDLLKLLSSFAKWCCVLMK